MNETFSDGFHEEADCRRSERDRRTDSWLNEAERAVKRRRRCDDKRPALADRDTVDKRWQDEAEKTRHDRTACVDRDRGQLGTTNDH